MVLAFLKNFSVKQLSKNSYTDFSSPESVSLDIKVAQVWDFDLLDFNDFFIMKSI
jgi:hypothetical protein